MIIDKENLFSNEQAITVTAVSTDVIDLGDDDAQVQALNSKGLLELWVQVVEAFAVGTSLKVTLQEDDDSAFSSPVDIIETDDILLASLVLGYKFRFGKLPEISKRYIRLSYTAVGTFTGGKVTAGLILDKQTNE